MTTTQFKQKAKIGVAGNLINQLMSNNSSLPKVGKGATQLHYSDRTCYEVVEVSDDFMTVKLEELNAIADKSKPCDVGHQNWILQPTGRFKTVVWRRFAWYQESTEITFVKEFFKRAEAENVSIWSLLTEEQRKQIYCDEVRPQVVVDGITKKKKVYSKLNLLFGTKDYYYDWSF